MAGKRGNGSKTWKGLKITGWSPVKTYFREPDFSTENMEKHTYEKLHSIFWDEDSPLDRKKKANEEMKRRENSGQEIE